MRAAALPFGYAAALILIFMMLFTTYAVVMRQVFDAPVLGVIDVMELALVACIFVAMPGVFLREENIVVDVMDQVVSSRIRAVLRLIGLVLTLGFLTVTLVEMLEPALEKLGQHEVTMTLGINRFNHWIPILFGFAFSVVASVWVLIHFLRWGASSRQTTGTGSGE